MSGSASIEKNSQSVRRTATIPYSFDIESGCGILDIGTPFHGDYAENCLASHSYAIQLLHKNYAHCNFVHLSGNADRKEKVPLDPKNKRPDIRIHQKTGIPYENHVNMLSKKGVFPIVDQKFSCKIFSYVPKEFRAIVKGPVELVLRIHEDGQSLKPMELTFANLLVVNGELVICGIDFRPSEGVKHFKSDWNMVHKLIKEKIFGGYDLSKVRDMKNFVDKMSSCESDSEAKFLRNHLAVMSYHQRISFVKNGYDMAKMFKSNPVWSRQYEKVVLHVGNVSNWTSRFQTKDICNTVKQCFCSHLQKGGHYNPSASDLLRCARNLETHLDEHQKPGISTQMEIDLMIMSVFAEELLLFHDG